MQTHTHTHTTHYDQFQRLQSRSNKIAPLNGALLNIPPRAEELKITDSNTCALYCLQHDGDLHLCIILEVNLAHTDFPFVPVSKQHLRDSFLLAAKEVAPRGFLRETGAVVLPLIVA